VLPAQTDREVRVPAPGLVDADAQDVPDALPIEVLEGICVDHLVAEVGAEKSDFG
jgi:hypothetical protein